MAVFTFTIFFLLFLVVDQTSKSTLNSLHGSSLALPKNLCPGGRISIACLAIHRVFLFSFLSILWAAQAVSETVCVCACVCTSSTAKIRTICVVNCLSGIRWPSILFLFLLFRVLRSFTAHHFFRRSNLILCCVSPKKNIYKSSSLFFVSRSVGARCSEGSWGFGKMENSPFLVDGSRIAILYSFSEN